MLMAFYESFGLKDLELHINSIGDFDSRKEYQKALQEHFRPKIDEFCDDCQSRIDTNPMRILDCKTDKNHPLMSTAPKITDYLNDESIEYYEKVKSQLDKIGIKYVEDPSLVRGLDYYTHTAFELMSTADGFGSITTLAGGGRYNGLVEMLDGPAETGIGFALSIERLLLALEAEGIDILNPHTLDLYVVTMGEESRDYASVLLSQLREKGITADMDYKARGMRAQMRDADRKNAAYTIVIGDNELEEGKVNVKNMSTGEEVAYSFENLEEAIQ